MSECCNSNSGELNPPLGVNPYSAGAVPKECRDLSPAPVETKPEPKPLGVNSDGSSRCNGLCTVDGCLDSETETLMRIQATRSVDKGVDQLAVGDLILDGTVEVTYVNFEGWNSRVQIEGLVSPRIVAEYRARVVAEQSARAARAADLKKNPPVCGREGCYGVGGTK